MNETFTSYTELPEIGAHALRVMGIHPTPSTGSLTSISDAGTLKISESHSGQTVLDINPSGAGQKLNALKYMLFLEQRTLLVICNSIGQIFIYSTMSAPMELLTTLKV